MDSWVLYKLFAIPAQISAAEDDLALAFHIVQIYLIFRWNNYTSCINIFNQRERNEILSINRKIDFYFLINNFSYSYTTPLNSDPFNTKYPLKKKTKYFCETNA